jgi:hypothetical protein
VVGSYKHSNELSGLDRMKSWSLSIRTLFHRVVGQLIIKGIFIQQDEL